MSLAKAAYIGRAMRTIGMFGALFAFQLVLAPAYGQEKQLTQGSYVGLSAPKAASTDTVASRGGVSAANSIYGGFQLNVSTTVYILVRGNSLSTLGVTSNYLDAPRVRLFNQSGQDLVTDNGGRPGFNGCVSANATTDLPVINYYTSRGPVQSRDACLAAVLPAGVYTFSVTPSVAGMNTNATTSVPSSGEILFEVTLGPAGAVVDNNQTRTERLVGGTWTYAYTIISTFSSSYRFTSVSPSTTSPGEYYAVGTDEFGGSVIGSYISTQQQWAVLDPSIIIDNFYTFTFSDTNHVSGCYYLIQPPGSTNLSRCYPMNGSRFPPKSAFDQGTPQQRIDENDALGVPYEVDPAAVSAYLQVRRELEKRGGRNPE